MRVLIIEVQATPVDGCHLGSAVIVPAQHVLAVSSQSAGRNGPAGKVCVGTEATRPYRHQSIPGFDSRAVAEVINACVGAIPEHEINWSFAIGHEESAGSPFEILRCIAAGVQVGPGCSRVARDVITELNLHVRSAICSHTAARHGESGAVPVPKTKRGAFDYRH